MAWTTPGTAVAGDVLTAAFWNEQVRDNLNALYGDVRRLAYVERTSTYTISATAVASAADVFSSDLTWTADGSTYLVEFYAPFIGSGSSAQFAIAHLVTGSGTSLGRMAKAYGASSTVQATVFARRFYTPSAGSVSINIRAVISGGSNGELGAGAGTADVEMPAYLAVYGPILT